MDHAQLSLEDESSTSTHATSVTGIAKLSPVHGNNPNKLISFQERRMQTLEMREQAREEKRLEQQRQAEAAIRETQERMRELRSNLLLAQTQQTQVMDNLADMKALSAQSSTTAVAAVAVSPSSDMAPILAKRRSTTPDTGVNFSDDDEEGEAVSTQCDQQELDSGGPDESAANSSEESLSYGEQPGEHGKGTAGSISRGKEKKKTERGSLLKRHLAKRRQVPDAATSSQISNATPPRRRSTLEKSDVSNSQNAIDQWRAQRESVNESQHHQSATEWREVNQTNDNRSGRGGDKRGDRRSSSKQPKGRVRGGSIASRDNARNPPRGVRRRRSNSLTAMDGQGPRGRSSTKSTAPPTTRKVGIKNITNTSDSLSQSERGLDSRTSRRKGRRSSSSTPATRKLRRHSNSVAADPLSQSERVVNSISTEKEKPSFNWSSYRKGQRRHTLTTPLATTVPSTPEKGSTDYMAPAKIKRCHTTGTDDAPKSPHDSIRFLQKSQMDQAALFQETLSLIQHESDSIVSLEDDLASRHRRRLQDEPSPLESLSLQQSLKHKSATHGLHVKSPKTRNGSSSRAAPLRDPLPSPTPPSHSQSSSSLLDCMPSSARVQENFLDINGGIHDDQNEGTGYFCPDNILHLSSSWNDLFSSSKTSVNQEQVCIPRRRGSFGNISLSSSGSDILHFEPEVAEELESDKAGLAEGSRGNQETQEDLLHLSGSLPDFFMNDDEVNEADEENMKSWNGQNTTKVLDEQLTFEGENQDLPTDPNATFWQQAKLENSGNSFASVFDCLSHSSDDPSTLLRHLQNQQSRGKPPFRWDVSSHHGNSTVASNSLKGSRHSRHTKSNPMKELRKHHQRGDKRNRETENNVEGRKQEPELSRLSHSKLEEHARKNERQPLPDPPNTHATNNSINKLPQPRKRKDERNTPARTRSRSLSDMERLRNQRRRSSADTSDEENTTQESSIDDDQKITKYIDLVGDLITKDQEQTFGGGPAYNWANSRSRRPASYDWMNHQSSGFKEGMPALAAPENTGTTPANGGVRRQRSNSLTDLVIVVSKVTEEELEDLDYDWTHCASLDPIETSDSIAHFTGAGASGALSGLLAESENRRDLLSEGQEQSDASRSMRSNDTAARKPMRRGTGALVRNFEKEFVHATDSQSYYDDLIHDSDGGTPAVFSEDKPRLPDSSTSLETFFNNSNSAANKSASDIERIFGWTAALRTGELDKSAHPSGKMVDAGPKTAHDAVSGEVSAEIFPSQEDEAVYEEHNSDGVTEVRPAASLQDFIRRGLSADEKQENVDGRTIDHTIRTGGAVQIITKAEASAEKVEKLDPIVNEGSDSAIIKDATEGQEGGAPKEKKTRRASRRHHSHEKGPTSQKMKGDRKRGGGRKSMSNHNELKKTVKKVKPARGRDSSKDVSSRSRSQSLTIFLKTDQDAKEVDGANIGRSSRTGGERKHETGQSNWYRKSTRGKEQDYKKSERKESGMSGNNTNRHQRSRSQSLAGAEGRKSRASSRVSTKDRGRKSSRDRLATSAHLELLDSTGVGKADAIEERGRERPMLGRFRSASLTEMGSIDRELHNARRRSVTAKKAGAKTSKKVKTRSSQKHNHLPGVKNGSSRRRPQRQISGSLRDIQRTNRTEEQPIDTQELPQQNRPVVHTYDWKLHSVSARSFVSSSPSSPVELANDGRGSLIRSRSQSLSNLFGDKREPSKSSRTMTKRFSVEDVPSSNDTSGQPGMHSYDWKTHSTSTRSMMSNSAKPERDRRSMLGRTRSESLSNLFGENRNPSEPGRVTTKRAGDSSQSRSNGRSSRTNMLSYDWKKHSVSDRSMMPDAANSARDRRSTLIRSRSQSLSNLFGDKREPSESSRHIPKRTDDGNRSASNGKRSCPTTRSHNWKQHSAPDRSTSVAVTSDKNLRSSLVRSRSVSLSKLFSDKREPSESSRHLPKRTSDDIARHGKGNCPNKRSYNWKKHSVPDSSTTPGAVASVRDYRSSLVGSRSVSLSNVVGDTSRGHTDNASATYSSTRGGTYDWTTHQAHSSISGDIDNGSTSRSSRAIHRRDYSVVSDSSEENVRNPKHLFESSAGQSTAERGGGTPYEYDWNSEYTGSAPRPRDGAEELLTNSGGREHEALLCRSMSDLSSLVISSIAEDPNENSDKSKLSLMDSSTDDLLFRSSSSLQKANRPVAGAANTAIQPPPLQAASEESKRSTDTTLSDVTGSSSFEDRVVPGETIQRTTGDL